MDINLNDIITVVAIYGGLDLLYYGAKKITPGWPYDDHVIDWMRKFVRGSFFKAKTGIGKMIKKK